jgi:hypothetical protein
VLSAIRGSETRSGQVVKPEWRYGQFESDEIDFEELFREIRQDLSIKNARKLSEQGLVPDQVEGALAVKLYATLSPLPGIVLTDPDFWRYLAVGEISDFVLWRDGASCSQASFGLDSARRIPDCVPLRMFNRIHIIEASNRDLNESGRQELALSGGADFWQSHVFRVYNRFDARLVLQLLDIKNQYQFSAAGAMRTIPKEIRKLRANLLIESLEELEFERMLVALADQVSET